MKREVRYDLLRIASCFAVVLLHVSFGYWSVVDINSKEFLIMTVYNSFTRFGVPVFFMLSGMFLLDPRKEMPVKKWLQKIWKLLLAFILWSAFYAFQSVIFHGLKGGWDSVTEEMWSSAITRLVMGHGHMWFLMDLLGFYLMLPVFRKICEDIKVLGYFLLLWVVVRFVITTLMPEVGNGLLFMKTDSLHLYFLIGYVGYFMGGYFLQKVEIAKRYRYLLYILGIGAIAFTILKTLQVNKATLAYDYQWFTPSNINILIFSIAAFVFYKYRPVPKKLSDSKLIQEMAKATFFVYMIHPFCIDKLALLGITVLKGPVILTIPVMTIGVFTVAMLMGRAVGKIPFIGKWITFQ